MLSGGGDGVAGIAGGFVAGRGGGNGGEVSAGWDHEGDEVAGSRSEKGLGESPSNLYISFAPFCMLCLMHSS